MPKRVIFFTIPLTVNCNSDRNKSIKAEVESLRNCAEMINSGIRPISETQFVVFILNASRCLFSARFFTSSFRPEFYSTMGLNWVKNNGPGPEQMEEGTPNGHRQQVSPLKRVLLRTMPELAPELQHVVNAFDPWARDRGEYYSLAWKPRQGAESDEAFKKTIGTVGVVRRDVNGHVNGQHSRTALKSPVTMLVYTPEGVAITEYQLLRLRENKDSREFRTVTGGVLHSSGGATRDVVPFDSKKTAPRTYEIVLSNLGSGDYGLLPPGGGDTSGSGRSGKIYSFRLLE